MQVSATGRVYLSGPFGAPADQPPIIELIWKVTSDPDAEGPTFAMVRVGNRSTEGDAEAIGEFLDAFSRTVSEARAMEEGNLVAHEAHFRQGPAGLQWTLELQADSKMVKATLGECSTEIPVASFLAWAEAARTVIGRITNDMFVPSRRRR